MGRIEMTIGDCLKNAGLVAMHHALKISEAKKDDDYGITEDGLSLWIDKDFALNVDWTALYMRTAIDIFGSRTAYSQILDNIKECLEKIQNGTWQLDKKAAKNEKEKLKFISDKLLSNSCKSGFENIKTQIQNPEVYENLQKNKLKEKEEPAELKKRLEELRDFLKQPLCAETFQMKNIIYNYINRFWDGKGFLLPKNPPPDIREAFEADFVLPFRRYIEQEHTKVKDSCIDCGNQMNSKERVSIAFMKEMADDLTRKKSAFWNEKVDAFLCPVCALIYAMSPMGFQLLGSTFMFLNTNNDLKALTRLNSCYSIEGERKEQELFFVWSARMMNVILEEKTNELQNVQVILKGCEDKDKYRFKVIQKRALSVLKMDAVKKNLKYLENQPFIKDKNAYINVYEAVVWNVLSGQHQYYLLNRILRLVLTTEHANGLLRQASYVYEIQHRMESTKGQEDDKEKGTYMTHIQMRNSGYALRKALLSAKNTNDDTCLRGMVYQLLNALSVRNTEKFLEIVMRNYCSCKLLVPDGFVYMLDNQDKFLDLGYAFVLGLKGSHPNEKEENREGENNHE